MSINLYAILLGIFLILIDIFFASDLPTFIALLLFCFAFFRLLPFSILVNMILTVIFFFILLVLFISVWRKVRDVIIDKWFAKDIYKAGVYHFPGSVGTVKEIDGKKYALIDGDLYAFYYECFMADGEKFIVDEVRDGMIVVKK